MVGYSGAASKTAHWRHDRGGVIDANPSDSYWRRCNPGRADRLDWRAWAGFLSYILPEPTDGPPEWHIGCGDQTARRFRLFSQLLRPQPNLHGRIAGSCRTTASAVP